VSFPAHPGEVTHDEPVDRVDVTTRIGYHDGWFDARA
jgi:hypothetical protein